MIHISNVTKEKVPVGRAFFVKMVPTVLGEEYELNLVFVSPKRSHFLNKKYRKRDHPTDILSFEYEKNLGEIYIDLKTAKKKSVLFGKTYKDYVKYLFIHGLCHLKGMVHGSRMESHVALYISRS